MLLFDTWHNISISVQVSGEPDIIKWGEHLKANLKSAVASAESVSVTVDIWSDRSCRRYPGITVHFIGDDKKT